MPNRDPDPQNELGTGLIDPDTERWLLSRGAVFAQTVIGPTGRPYVRFSCRPLREAAAGALNDARRRLSAVPSRTLPINAVQA
jgi:hypothetical protein